MKKEKTYVVYTITYQGKVMYVGCTDNFKARVQQHKKQGKNSAIPTEINPSECTIEIVKECTDKVAMRKYEDRLIVKYETIDKGWNKVRSGYVKKDPDYIKEQSHQYYLKNKEVIDEKHRAYKAEHKEKLLIYHREYYKAWYANNKDRKAEYNKQYDAEHRQERLDYQKQYYAANKDKVKARYLEHRDERVAYMRDYNAKKRMEKMKLKDSV